ncbi:MAG TPA: terminase, partial [Bacteroidetes bacterium]|nr:terminase [Bacteroidota bacterium]
MSNPKIDVVWEPIPNSSQELALCAPADIVFFDGARGPGKTITQCMRFRARVGIGYGKFWRGVIFDREHD